jgi:membrane protease YdiL (CAAX protease family)
MTQKQTTSTIPQYSLIQILCIWTAAAIPMGVLGWIVAPALAQSPTQPGFERLAVLTVGLIWQFILAMILLYRETGNFRWATIKQRLWLETPHSPKTGIPRKVLWIWLFPFLILKAADSLYLGKFISFTKIWVSIFPFLAEPPGFDFGAFMGSPETQAQMVGNWGIFALFVVMAIFNTVLGEELLFRGILLPRMNGVFGKWDWVANGVLFGLYHVSQPWGILDSAISGVFFFALPTKYFRCAWFGIIAHSGQSVFLTFLMLGLVLGLA